MERTILLPETEAQQCLGCRGRRKPEGVALLRGEKSEDGKKEFGQQSFQ